MDGLSTTEVYLSQFWMLRVQDHGDRTVGSGESPLPGCRWQSFHAPSYGRKRQLAPSSSYMGMSPIHEGTHSYPNHVPKMTPPNVIPLGIQVQQTHFAGCDHLVHDKHGFSSLTSSHVLLMLNLTSQTTNEDSRSRTAFGARWSV